MAFPLGAGQVSLFLLLADSELEEQFMKAHAKKSEPERLLERLGVLSFFDPACG